MQFTFRNKHGFNSPKKQQNIRLLSRLDDFEHDFLFGDAGNSGKRYVVVNSGPVDREFTVDNKGGFSRNIESTVTV